MPKPDRRRLDRDQPAAAPEIIPPSPAGADDVPANLRDVTPAHSRRYDGWTGERQRVFLEALSQGSSVAHACQLVGLTAQSAYAFRRAARGASFAIGWQAAVLLGGEVLADDLMDRARNGTRQIHFSADGETHYNRHDNTLAFRMLSRADRIANSAQSETAHAAARMVAGDFEQYLDMIARDGGPARAGLFLGARLGARIGPDGDLPAGNDDLAPVRALARADHWLRTHTDLAEPLATADLDPANRAGWSAEQWLRAEAAGLLELAPPPPPPAPPLAAPAVEPDADIEAAELTKLHQHSPELHEDPPVWWSEDAAAWRTRFPAPEGFAGVEENDYGDPLYARELAPGELAILDADIAAETAELRAYETVERDAWFARMVPAPGGAGLKN